MSALAGAVLLLLACGRSDPGRPDIVLVTIDTLRADRLACYGGNPDVGGSLCGVAAGGTRFTWAVSASPLTVPSVASILTSTYPSQHGFSQWDTLPLSDDLATLAEALAGQGYGTAAIVSNPVLQRDRGLERGFAHYDDRMPSRERNRPGFAERVASDTTDAALEWLASASGPWFLWIHYQDPHGPYTPPEAAPLRDPRGSRQLPIDRQQSGFRGIPVYQALPGLFAAASYVRRYDDEIRYVDAQVGRLREALAARAREPVLIVTADHGEALGEDGYYFAHGHSVGLDQIRVPLLIRAPGLPPGVVSQPVSLLDVAPTVAQLAGVTAPPSFRGRSLLEAPARPNFAEHHARRAVVAEGLYYARDLVDLRARVKDPNTWARLRPLPPRVAQLGPGGVDPVYREAQRGGPAERLEELIAGFAPARRAPASEAPLDAGTRASLRALGYLPEEEPPIGR
jgi:arylsulfatase